MSNTSSHSTKIVSILILCLCVIKLIWLFSQGPDFCDLRPYWYGSKVLLRGDNPYKDFIIRVLQYERESLAHQESALKNDVQIDNIPSPRFPPICLPFHFIVLSPWTLFSWNVGANLFLCISMLCLGLSLFILWREMNRGGSEILLFLVLSLLLFGGEPVDEALRKGQASLIVAFGLLLATRGKINPVVQISGLITATIKPFLWPVIGIYWLTKNDISSKYKRVMLLSVCLCQILPLLFMHDSLGEIIKSYFYLVDSSFGPRTENSFSYALASYNMITLDALWYRLFPEGSSVLTLYIIKFSIILGIAALSILYLRKNISLCLLNLCCLQYLAFYNRRYNLPFLILIGFWAVSKLEKKDLRRYLILLSLIVLSIPHFWQGASWLEKTSRAFLAGLVSIDIWILLLLPVTNLFLSYRRTTKSVLIQT